MCGADDCTYTVSTKQRVNRCKAHPKMGPLQTGPCSCYIAYFYPLDPKEDGRHWFVVINAESTTAGDLHNHLPPSEWKLPPKMISDIVDATKRNIHLKKYKKVLEWTTDQCRCHWLHLTLAEYELL